MIVFTPTTTTKYKYIMLLNHTGEYSIFLNTYKLFTLMKIIDVGYAKYMLIMSLAALHGN